MSCMLYVNLFLGLCLVLFFCFNLKEIRKKEIKVMENVTMMSNIITDIYKHNKWGIGSGPGSYEVCTKDYLLYLYKFIKVNKIKRVIDFGCGDWQMLSHFNFSNDIYYFGYDVVKGLVDRNKKLYEKKNIKFFYLNHLNDKIQHGDLIMIKDVLMHWENKYIKYYLENIFPKYKYGLIVNDFIKSTTNREIQIGEFRPLNLEKHPFVFNGFNSIHDMMFCNTLKRIYIKS